MKLRRKETEINLTAVSTSEYNKELEEADKEIVAGVFSANKKHLC